MTELTRIVDALWLDLDETEWTTDEHRLGWGACLPGADQALYRMMRADSARGIPKRVYVPPYHEPAGASRTRWPVPNYEQRRQEREAERARVHHAGAAERQARRAETQRQQDAMRAHAAAQQQAFRERWPHWRPMWFTTPPPPPPPPKPDLVELLRKPPLELDDSQKRWIAGELEVLFAIRGAGPLRVAPGKEDEVGALSLDDLPLAKYDWYRQNLHSLGRVYPPPLL